MVTQSLPERFYLGTRVVVFDKVRENPHQPNAYGATVTHDLPAVDRKQDEKDDQLIN